MAGTFPRFRLYQENGVTEVYEFEQVTDWGDSPFQDPETFVLHESLRGQGGIVSEGSQEIWELVLTFRLSDTDYEGLVAKMKAVKDTITFNTKYILKIDLTSGGSTLDLKVKRLQSVRFPITSRTQKVVTSQQGIITFTVDAWS